MRFIRYIYVHYYFVKFHRSPVKTGYPLFTDVGDRSKVTNFLTQGLLTLNKCES